MKVLERSFFARTPTTVARDLLGKCLVRRLDNGQELEGIIVETEAYAGKYDPASHAYRGMTPRNAVMFGEPGHAYVYFTYGFHHCLNFVTSRKGAASAVLVRAVEPRAGLEIMSKYRKTEKIAEISNGPGKVCQAFAIGRDLNGCDVTKVNSPIRVLDRKITVADVRASRRIGINVAIQRKWRYYVNSSHFVSRRRKPPD